MYDGIIQVVGSIVQVEICFQFDLKLEENLLNKQALYFPFYHHSTIKNNNNLILQRECSCQRDSEAECTNQRQSYVTPLLGLIFKK